MATSRRLQLSDTGGFADWVAPSSSSAADLSLGFNGGPTAAGGNTTAPDSVSSAVWTATARNINCGLPPELFFVAPAPSFHNHHPDAAATTTINFDPHSIGVIPLLTGTPRLRGGDEEGLNNAGIRVVSPAGVGSTRLWQYPQPGNISPVNYLKKPMNNNNNNNTDHIYLLQSGGNNTGDSSSTGTTTCQDCGNQAKKGCSHRRCRTCCKNRGFDCTTHVKSTWVPATRRRERQLMGTNTAGSSQSTSSAKKPRLGPPSQTTSHTSTSNNANTPRRSFGATSSHQDEGFRDPLPGQVNAPAVFKCVRVTAVDDDGEDEYAYQAVVRIGGHVFKGFLYDQGFDQAKDNVLFPNVSDLHLGGGGSRGDNSDRRNGAPYSHQLLDPSHDLYGGGGGLMGGSSFGNSIN
ncbi:hypothetical protein OROMI_016268 [Orobanche minor]